MSDFLKVKQDEQLYQACLEANEARANSEYTRCYDAVCQAFRYMALRLCKQDETIDNAALYEKLVEQSLMTDRSLAGFRAFLVEPSKTADSLQAENAYSALEEETNKYATYYQKGISPKTIEELHAGFSDGIHTTRGQRNGMDSVFSMILVLVLIVGGLLLLLLSALIPAMSNWLVGGVVFLAAGILFGYMNVKVKK